MATTAMATGLPAAALERFRADGFVVVDDVFSPGEITELRAAVEAAELPAEQLRQGGDSATVHLLGLTSRHPAFAALARDQRIVQMLIPLLGPDIQLQHAKLAVKPQARERGPYPWHQDFAYFPHTNTDLVAVMVMLDDATPDNGCMRMVRGSHRDGLAEHRSDGAFSGGCTEPRRWADASRIVDITPRAGGISIHHCLTLHGSPANRSGLPRRGIVFQYRADDAHQLADTVFDDTGTQICGARRGVVRCESGRWLLPLRPGWGNGFGSAWNQQGARAAAFNDEHAPITQPTRMPDHLERP
ncbi:MAG TPA: phytanoyl-CoA dioxygenase family protein [Planctomycetota bacterium]|nr:phytanoyl-CoA dioxygenase family protein [Planctomycetota bacterium]